MKWKLLIVTLCTVSCLAVALQIIYEMGAVAQGFPTSVTFLVIFYWQIVSIAVIIFATVIGLTQTFRYRRVTPVSLFLAAIYPLILAGTALWPTTWTEWISMFKIFPNEGVLRLTVALLPALFTTSLMLVFMNRISKNIPQGV